MSATKLLRPASSLSSGGNTSDCATSYTSMYVVVSHVIFSIFYFSTLSLKEKDLIVYAKKRKAVKQQDALQNRSEDGSGE